MKKASKQSFDFNVYLDALAENISTKMLEKHVKGMADAITQRIKDNMNINANLENELKLAQLEITKLKQVIQTLRNAFETSTKLKTNAEDAYNKLVNDRTVATNITRMKAMESALSEAKKEIAQLVEERQKMEPLMVLVSDTIKRHVDTCVQHTENACREHETNEVV